MPSHPKDETGKRYGCLRVLRQDMRSFPVGGRHRTYWLCRCDCGNDKSILVDHLRSGATVSCTQCNTGCSVVPPVTIQGHRGRPIKWEVGNRYGHLTVVERQRRSDPKSPTRWICKCDCGAESVVQGGALRAGRVRGCWDCSYGPDKRRHLRKRVGRRPNLSANEGLQAS